jgi:RimJ/RimL family protein N-acetyltransferase
VEVSVAPAARVKAVDSTAPMLRLEGDRVVLRAFRPDELELVVAARERGQTPGVPRSPRTRIRQRLERSGRLVRGWIDMAIEAEGQLVGEVDARQPSDSMPPGVFELGILLYDAAERGKGYGSEAIALLTDHLFEREDGERVQGSTAVANTAMRRVFIKLGFVEEGIMRGFMPGPNGREDYALYGVTKDEWRRRAGSPRSIA